MASASASVGHADDLIEQIRAFGSVPLAVRGDDPGASRERNLAKRLQRARKPAKLSAAQELELADLASGASQEADVVADLMSCENQSAVAAGRRGREEGREVACEERKPKGQRRDKEKGFFCFPWCRNRAFERRWVHTNPTDQHSPISGTGPELSAKNCPKRPQIQNIVRAASHRTSFVQGGRAGGRARTSACGWRRDANGATLGPSLGSSAEKLLGFFAGVFCCCCSRIFGTARGFYRGSKDI